MSVLKSRRTQSKAEFVSVANTIYIETLNFLSRLSARYSRLLAADTARTAATVSNNVMAANTLQPTDETRYVERKTYLIRARGALAALDYQMAKIYEILMLNPEGAFGTPSGKSVAGEKARERLDKMAQSLGEKIDQEERLLNGVLKSDRERFLAKNSKT